MGGYDFGIANRNRSFSLLKWACLILYALSSTIVFGAMGFLSRKIRIFRNRFLTTVVFFIHSMILTWGFNL